MREQSRFREHMLDACTGLGDATVTSLLRFRDRIVFRALALDVHAPALLGEPFFTLAIDIALVGKGFSRSPKVVKFDKFK